jgi:hypothetical protein
MHVAAEDDSSSLLPIGERQKSEFGTREISQRQVAVGTLEEYLSPTLPGRVLLKIDVQGCELDVLVGAGDALSLVDEVFAECSFVPLYEGQALADEVICYLRARGFSLVGVFGLTRSSDGECLQADLLFRRADGEPS